MVPDLWASGAAEPRPLITAPARRSPLPARGTVDPTLPALITPAGGIDHGELRDRVDQAAAELPSLTRGKLLVHLTPGPTVEDIVGYLAVLEAGHVALVSGPGQGADRLAAAWSPDLTVRDGVVVEKAATHTPRLIHPDLALLLSTSGSTGSPKLVRLSHENVVANAEAIAAALGLTAADRGITSLPLHYCFGLSVLHSHLAVGGSVALTDGSVLDDELWARVDAGVTSLAVVPHMVELMETTGVLERDHPSLRAVIQAGGRMAPERARRTAELGRRHGWDLRVMYGQTEATARIAVAAPGLALRAPDAVGSAVPGTEVVLDTSVPEAESGSGEVVVRGPGVMLGYAEHVDDLALGRMVSELRTGDLGRLEDGVLRIVGRRSGFVKVLGLRIDLTQVERTLEESGLTACVTGDDHGLRVLVEQPDGECSSAVADLARTVAARTAGLTAGHVLVAAGPLARLDNGKVDRAGCDAIVLATRAVSSAASARSSPFCCNVEDMASSPDAEGRAAQVGAAIGEVLGRDVELDRSFVEQGGDSLSHVQASTRLTLLLGELPRDWHHRPLRSLSEAPAAPAPDSRRRWQWLREHTVPIESSVLLRAVAAVIILASHAQLIRFLGGAHTLLVVAGFNAALFGLSATTAAERWRGSTRLIVGLALPTMAVALVGLSYGRYGWDNVFMVNWLMGDIAHGSHNELWFVDALVACTLVVAAVLSIPPVARRWVQDPWPVAFGIVLLALVPRFVILSAFDGVIRGMMPTVLWLFAVGMALATAHTLRRRLLTLGAMAAGIVTFFPDATARNLTILAGVAVLALVPRVRVPTGLVPLISGIAAASLHIYLIQFQVLDLISHTLVATVASLVAGVVLWRVLDRPVRRLQDLTSQVSRPAQARSGAVDTLGARRIPTRSICS